MSLGNVPRLMTLTLSLDDSHDDDHVGDESDLLIIINNLAYLIVQADVNYLNAKVILFACTVLCAPVQVHFC